MADLSIILNETLTVFGPDPANEWGVAVMGTDNWGYNNDIPWTFTKVLQDTFVSTDTIGKQSQKTFSESMTITATPDLVALQDGSGYDYVLPGGVTDPDNRNFPVYNEDDAASDTWTPATDASDTWGDA